MLFLLVAVLLILAFILTPMPSSEAASEVSLSDFTFPEISDNMPIQALFGKARIAGNLIYFGNIRNRAIYV